MHTQKGSTESTVVIVIVLICLIALAAYFLHQKPVVQTTTPPATTTTTVTTTTPVDTYGMSQYTDATYGFSFWYPSTLAVTATSTADTADFPGGTAVETLDIGAMGGTSVVVVNSPTSSITDEPSDHASPIPQTKYTYNATTGQWMVSYPEGSLTGGAATGPAPADTSKITMSGLVMLPSGKRFDTTIIPLGTTQFLVISDGGGSSFTPELAATVTQTGASVDPSTEAAALEAEASASANE